VGRLSLAIIFCSLLTLPVQAQKRQTESELDGLRGAVKTVAVEQAGLKRSSGKLIESARSLSAVTTYDVNGDRASEKHYDEAGRLTRVNSYTDADGYRVESGESFDYGDGRILRAPVPGADPQRGSDLKDTAKYKYKYDGGGAVSEVGVYSEGGFLDVRLVYKTAGKRKEILTYVFDGPPGGRLNDTEVYTYDEKGNEVEKARYFPESDEPDSRETYEYVEFDARGNWTKRKVSGESQAGARILKSAGVEYRRITYY
jgi:hypothetical protein